MSYKTKSRNENEAITELIHSNYSALKEIGQIKI